MTNITPNKAKLYVVMDELTTYQNGRFGSLTSRPYCIKKKSVFIENIKIIFDYYYWLLFSQPNGEYYSNESRLWVHLDRNGLKCQVNSFDFTVKVNLMLPLPSQDIIYNILWYTSSILVIY